MSQLVKKEAPLISRDLLTAYYHMRVTRRHMRIFYSVFNLRKIIKSKDKDTKSFLRRLYLVSKICAFLYYAMDTFLTLAKYIIGPKTRLMKSINFIKLSFFVMGNITL